MKATSSSSLDLAHAARQGLLAPSNQLMSAFAREFALAVVDLDVAPHRHPITHIVGKQCRPILAAPLVKQIGFAIKELLDLLLQQRADEAIICHSESSSRPRNSRTRSITSFFG
jgi:hypothetical protein